MEIRVPFSKHLSLIIFVVVVCLFVFPIFLLISTLKSIKHHYKYFQYFWCWYFFLRVVCIIFKLLLCNRKIYFSPNGTCLFSGAQDILKIYAWEPIRTLDTLVMGWGQVSDIASSESQLVCFHYSTSMYVYIF